MWRLEHIVRELLANAVMAWSPIRQARVRAGRTTSTDVAKQARLTVDQFRFFIGTIGWESIRGKSLLEIGPGDAIPLALLFLGAGARRYVGLDRFLGDVRGPSALGLYEAIGSCAPDTVQAGWASLKIEPSRVGFEKLISDPQCVTLISAPMEQASALLVGSADYLVGFNVLEHMLDMEGALRNMITMLRPSGVMIHRVDYGPHDIWKSYSNPLAYLTISDGLWDLLGSNRGYPNRIRHWELMRLLDKVGMKTADRVTQRATASLIDAVRPYLPKRFGTMQDSDLGVLAAELASSRVGVPSLGREFHLSGDP